MPERQSRLVGDERQALARVLADRYNDGAAIRSLAQECGRSYGLVRRLLAEAGVEFRARGGIDPASPETSGEQDAAESTPAEEDAVEAGSVDDAPAEDSAAEDEAIANVESGAPAGDETVAGQHPAKPAAEADPEADEDLTAADLAKAEAKASVKARKAEQRLAKALRTRAKLTKDNSSKKERKAAKKKVSQRRRKADKAAERLQRIREEMDARTAR
ncbi:MAG: helix-turn-helix domain-containing protein [Acidipropionibacterium sp.]|jgi:hypothetical protein|nr:helix-turn-helix domain-containing protein [Acidipropionibacterium sp.]